MAGFSLFDFLVDSNYSGTAFTPCQKPSISPLRCPESINSNDLAQLSLRHATRTGRCEASFQCLRKPLSYRSCHTTRKGENTCQTWVREHIRLNIGPQESAFANVDVLCCCCHLVSRCLSRRLSSVELSITWRSCRSQGLGWF